VSGDTVLSVSVLKHIYKGEWRYCLNVSVLTYIYRGEVSGDTVWVCLYQHTFIEVSRDTI